MLHRPGVVRGTRCRMPAANMGEYASPNRSKPVPICPQAVPAEVAGAPSGAVCHSVKLGAPLAAGEVASLSVSAVLAKAQTPFPAEITQTEQQLMTYTDNVYVMSPYAVSAQTTEVGQRVRAGEDGAGRGGEDGRGTRDLLRTTQSLVRSPVLQLCCIGPQGGAPESCSSSSRAWGSGMGGASRHGCALSYGRSHLSARPANLVGGVLAASS